MKVKEEAVLKFLAALEGVARAIRNESEACGKLCGGLNEKELFVINYIGANKNVKMSDIAENIDTPMSTLTNIVDKLVEKKYLAREHDSSDRRVINVMLAENGKASLKVLNAKKKRVADKVLSNFTEKEQNQFMQYMNILASSLSEK